MPYFKQNKERSLESFLDKNYISIEIQLQKGGILKNL